MPAVIDEDPRKSLRERPYWNATPAAGEIPVSISATHRSWGHTTFHFFFPERLLPQLDRKINILFDEDMGTTVRKNTASNFYEGYKIREVKVETREVVDIYTDRRRKRIIN